ncbi:MAG: DUF805 domain-containing protein [Hyphomonadaceae bacterium]
MVSLLFSFNGRINRAQFWLGNFIGGFACVMLFFLLGVMTLPAGNLAKETMNAVAALHLISSMGLSFGAPLLLMGWIGSSLQVKRFHDRGRSGLWALAPMLPAFMLVSSIVGGIITGAHPDQILSSAGTWFTLLQVVNFAMFVDLGCMSGKPEANKYGPPPGDGFAGGASAGGAPMGGVPIVGQPPRTNSQPVPGMGSTLTGAESAIDRAIAAQSKQNVAAVLGPRPATAAAQAGGGLRPTTSGSFGRRASS